MLAKSRSTVSTRGLSVLANRSSSRVNLACSRSQWLDMVLSGGIEERERPGHAINTHSCCQFCISRRLLLLLATLEKKIDILFDEARNLVITRERHDPHSIAVALGRISFAGATDGYRCVAKRWAGCPGMTFLEKELSGKGGGGRYSRGRDLETPMPTHHCFFAHPSTARLCEQSLLLLLHPLKQHLD